MADAREHAETLREKRREDRQWERQHRAHCARLIAVEGKSWGIDHAGHPFGHMRCPACGAIRMLG